MPRISPLLIRQAHRASPLLPRLLQTCRTLPEAQQELRWIQSELPPNQWTEAVIRRSQKVPLQYILGTQPFGDLMMECEEGVLIPRWETEEWTVKLAGLMKDKEPLKMIDLCTGTGCVALLMASRLKRSTMKGVDISGKALELSLKNKSRNGIENVGFHSGDVFDQDIVKGQMLDLVTANPPYISEEDYKGHGTETSVRLYEPELALVGGNEFFSALVKNVVLPSQAKGFVFELGYKSQYEHTASLLPSMWDSKLYYDGAGHPRCAVGWIRGSNMQVLENI